VIEKETLIETETDIERKKGIGIETGIGTETGIGIGKGIVIVIVIVIMIGLVGTEKGRENVAKKEVEEIGMIEMIEIIGDIIQGEVVVIVQDIDLDLDQ